MISESAITLAQDELKLSPQYGFLTPSVAMGSALRDRLEKRDIHFYIEDE